jgi:hypothetical protein
MMSIFQFNFQNSFFSAWIGRGEVGRGGRRESRGVENIRWFGSEILIPIQTEQIGSFVASSTKPEIEKK